MGDVLRKHRPADAVRPGKHDVGGFLEEVERDQRINGGAVAVLPVQFARSTSFVHAGYVLGSRDEGVLVRKIVWRVKLVAELEAPSS